MAPGARVVIATNTLISRLLVPASMPARAVREAIEQADLLISEETMDELAEVIARPKFDRYVTVGERQAFVQLVGRVAELIPIVRPIQACRDPRDDKFLALAVNGEGDLILSGDRDLLVLDPFRGIRIMNPATHVRSEVPRQS